MKRESRSDVALSVIVSGVSGALPIFGGFVEPIAENILQKAKEEWTRNHSKALEVAQRAAGLERDQLGEAIANNPSLIPLYVRILYAAGMNGHDEVLRTIGTLFGGAVKEVLDSDTYSLDYLEAILSSLDGLGPIHFRILHALESGQIPNESGSKDQTQHSSDLISAHLTIDQDLADMCLNNLASAGLIITVSGYSSLVYKMSNVGRQVLLASGQAGE
jgi:hypothetical protein